MIYFIVKDGRVPSKKFVKEIAEKMNRKTEFPYRHGILCNSPIYLLAELNEKTIEDWDIILIIPSETVDGKIDTFMTDSIELKKLILQHLEANLTSKKLTGELLSKFFT